MVYCSEYLRKRGIIIHENLGENLEIISSELLGNGTDDIINYFFKNNPFEKINFSDLSSILKMLDKDIKSYFLAKLIYRNIKIAF